MLPHSGGMQRAESPALTMSMADPGWRPPHVRGLCCCGGRSPGICGATGEPLSQLTLSRCKVYHIHKPPHASAPPRRRTGRIMYTEHMHTLLHTSYTVICKHPYTDINTHMHKTHTHAHICTPAPTQPSLQVSTYRQRPHTRNTEDPAEGRRKEATGCVKTGWGIRQKKEPLSYRDQLRSQEKKGLDMVPRFPPPHP